MTGTATLQRPPARPRGQAAPVRSAAATAQWRLASTLFVVLVASVSALTGVFQGAAWWWLALFAAALVLFGCAALRALGIPAWLAPAGGAVLIVAAASALFGAGTGVLLVIPTSATVQRIGALLVASSRSIAQETIPSQEVEPLMLLVLLGTGVVALAMDVLAVVLGLPAFCGIPMLMMLSIPIVLLDTGLAPIWIIVCLAAFLLLLVVADGAVTNGAVTNGGGLRRIGRRTRRAGLLAAAGGMALALIIGMTAPGFTSFGTMPFTTSGSVLAGGVNPLIDLGKDLREPVPMTVLDYSTTSSGDLYLKLTSLDRFTGATWTRSSSSQRPLADNGAVGAVPGLDKGVKTSPVVTKVDIRRLRSPWIPAPYPATSIDGLDGRWAVSTDDLTVSSRNSSAADQSYTVDSEVVQPTEAQLRAADTTVPAAVKRDLDLPKHVPAIIVDSAKKAVKGARTEYAEAVALQAFFRDGDFRYSLQTPLKEGYDGDGLAVIAKFLKVKSGYCVHFASAMAIMARVLGIPARVAIGYLPGRFAGSAGTAGYRYTVSSDELHSWPELYFAGVGWLPFEPTVGQGVVPSYSVAAAPVATSQPAPSESAAPVPTATSALPDQGHDIGASGQGRLGEHPDLRLAGILLVVVLVLLLPAMARQGRRTVRRVTVRRGRDPAAAAWRELDATARDLGLVLGRVRTPRDFAARLSRTSEDDPAVLRLRDAVERELYARPRECSPAERTALLADLDAALAALATRANWGRRMLATFAPPSLLREPAVPAPSAVP